MKATHSSLIGSLHSLALAVLLAVGLAGVVLVGPSPAQTTLPQVDTALVLAVDVSNSVDERRYNLQLDGIAKALEDPSVISAILNGPRGAIILSIVTWSDRADVALPWMVIRSTDDAREVAARVRAIPRLSGEFTCLSRALEFVNDKVLAQVPADALKTVVDVSGDGRDNCNADTSVAAMRDIIVGYGTTINGLPILEGSEGATLEQYYTDNVKGGFGSFVLAADGFDDFGRAIRQKFIVEISAAPSPAPRGSLAEGPVDVLGIRKPFRFARVPEPGQAR
ncbi:MAG: DUF1194 domain-containing protein [Hyphomicrobiaceae bacterium]|nr:DUF1194 domain-containing protein [Hyphomicrobiaceae bacterium]